MFEVFDVDLKELKLGNGKILSIRVKDVYLVIGLLIGVVNVIEVKSEICGLVVYWELVKEFGV